MNDISTNIMIKKCALKEAAKHELICERMLLSGGFVSIVSLKPRKELRGLGQTGHFRH